MKKKIQILLALFLVSTISLFAQEEMTEEQKVWMEYMTPGQFHSLLAEHVGEWDAKISFWMQPGEEPTVSTGSAKNEMIMGGRYLKSTFSGTTWGMPFEGMSLEGFDNTTKEFTSIWIDNMGTGTMVTSGKYDEESKMITYTGEMVDPMSGGKVQIRETVSFNNKDSHTLKMYMVNGEEEFQSMQVDFTRK